MHRLSVSEFSSFRWTFFQDVVRLNGLGFQTVGLWREKVADFGFEEAAELLDEMQTSVSSLSWAGGFTGSNGYSHRLAIEDAIEAVYQAHMVGADNLIVHSGERNGHTDNHAMRLFRLALDEVTPIACDLGITLLLEPVTQIRNPWNFLNRIEQYTDLLNDYSKSELGLVLDLFHIGRNQQFADRLSQIADRVRLVQLSDGRFVNGEFVRCQLGKGIVPVERWMALLAENDFEGDYELELHGYEFEQASYAKVLEQSQDFFIAATSRQLSKATSFRN